MQHGKLYRRDAPKLIEAKMDLPFAWRDVPTLENQGYDWYLEAFADLSSCRNIGFSVGQIPWTAVIKYVEHEEIKEVDDFIHIIGAMDSAYLEYANNPTKPTQNKQHTQPKTGRR